MKLITTLTVPGLDALNNFTKRLPEKEIARSYRILFVLLLCFVNIYRVVRIVVASVTSQRYNIN